VTAGVPDPRAEPGRGAQPADQGGDAVPALRRCVGDPERFAAEHWARAPLHRPGADPAAFADLFSLADVDHLVTRASLRTPAFRLVKDGVPLPPSASTRSGRIGSQPLSDLADPARILDQFAAGATIVLQSLHRYWPPLTRFCRELELALTHPVQVNVYVTPPASRGLGVHHDGHDVFVLQVHGRKQWDVYDAGDDSGAGAPIVDAELAPGDALYVPRTFPHQARTAETASVHLTIGVLRTTWRDVLSRAVDEAFTDRALDDPLPIGWAEDPGGLAAVLAGRIGELAARLEKVDALPLAQRQAHAFWSSRPPLLEGQIAQLLAVDRIADDTVLARRPGSVCRLAVDGDRLVVTLADRDLRMPAALLPALELVRDRPSFTPADLADHLDPDGRLVLARRLVREGLLTARHPGA